MRSFTTKRISYFQHTLLPRDLKSYGVNGAKFFGGHWSYSEISDSTDWISLHVGFV